MNLKETWCVDRNWSNMPKTQSNGKLLWTQ